MKTFGSILILALLASGAPALAQSDNQQLHEHQLKLRKHKEELHNQQVRMEFHQQANRGYMGVSLRAVETLDDDGNLDARSGVYVASLTRGGAAQAAGIQPKDKLVFVNGVTIERSEDVTRALTDGEPGDIVTVVVDRGGREQTLQLELKVHPAHEDIEFGHGKWVVEHEAHPRAFVGVQSQQLTEQLARYFDVEGGLLVTRVVEGSPAEQAGLEAGDVIVELEQTQVRSTGDLTKALAQMEPGTNADLLVSRRGRVSSFSVTLGEAPRAHNVRIEAAPKVKVRSIKEKSRND